ncbi:Uncharacterised protein [BD1-7 clade bacterium]|uniref:Single-stranded DNA-binding protein n=1 Tax=BD1-7 clade bacterium TaxID=2029982 RepID=A0A5S9PAM1_9GAMM|nr:Uncharacterised protein [BD1-7 clade bacterium]CAA0101651.1 Uncharacterised protein [BD1-7 clade bacterium]
MLKVSIIDGHHQPQSRNTQKGVRYFQNAYVDLGGAYPQHIELPIKAPSEAHPIGDYNVSISSFQVGRYKNLELNPFELSLDPASKAKAQ